MRFYILIQNSILYKKGTKHFILNLSLTRLVKYINKISTKRQYNSRN